MPPRSAEIPDLLQPFVAHGVEFARTDRAEVEGTCPWCSKHRFYVNTENGKWCCHVCAVETGQNVYGFLVRVWEAARESTRQVSYDALSFDRGVSADSLRHYGLAIGPTGEWLAPGYGSGGTLVNLYRLKAAGGGKRRFFPTPGGGLHHGYYRPTVVPDYARVEVVEGVWDACARWDALGGVSTGKDDVLVVGSPGCNVWSEGWGVLCAGKPVSVLFDNDHPRTVKKTGATIQPAWQGTKRTVELLRRFSVPPAAVSVLQWGPGGYDPSLPSGYDLRDVCVAHNGTAREFVDARVVPAPAEWSSAGGSSPKNTPLRATKCTSWDELRKAWKGAIHYTDEFEAGLLFALCVGAAVTCGENRLWGRLIGNAGTGKTMVCNGLSTSLEYVVTESVINGFYSGMDTRDGKDHSFADRLWDKLWVNNDADTMRTNDNRETIFAQMRDLYGGKGSKAFHNGIGSRSYNGLRFGVLFAGTPEIYQIDGADLGARFLDFFFEKPCPEVEEMIVLSALARQMSGTADSSGMSPQLKLATSATGGYLEHLREQVDRYSPRADLTRSQQIELYRLGQYVAKMRSRPPVNQEEVIARDEIPTRVTTQLGSLVLLSAVVRGKSAPDLGSFRLARRVALDTTKGRTHEIVSAVAKAGDRGLDFRGITGKTRKSAHTEMRLVNYLCEPGVDVLEQHDCGVPSLTHDVRYRLHPQFAKVYHSVFPNRGEQS